MATNATAASEGFFLASARNAWFASDKKLDDGAPVGSGASTCVASGGKVSSYPNASDAWLASMPRGAYTNARTVNRSSVFELEFHIERLASSVNMMRNASEGHFAGEFSQALTAHDIRRILLAQLEAGINGHRKANPSYSGELKLAFLITWDKHATDDGAAAEPRAHVHVAPMGDAPPKPVKAMIAGQPRENAAAKDSAWVAQRLALEGQKPADVNEVLLQDADGRILEGSSSNFFAIMDGVVHTAGEGVLQGSVRRAVIEACTENGVQVVMEAPKASDASRWEGALITSTSRLALPIDILVLPGGGEKLFLSTEASLANHIEAWVKARVQTSSSRVV